MQDYGVYLYRRSIPITTAVPTEVPFTPASLPGLVAWYKADAGLFSDTAGTLPSSDGGLVARWNDQSGNNNHLTSDSTANAPSYSSTGFNGLQTVIFDPLVPTAGLTDTSFSGLDSVTAFSAFFVTAPSSFFQPNARISACAGSAGGDTASGSFIWGFAGSSTEITTFGNVAILSNSSFARNTNYRYGVIFYGTSETQYLNGVAADSDAYATALSTGQAICLGGGLSGAHTANEAYSGNISEAVITNTALSSANIQRLDDYFTAKWGL